MPDTTPPKKISRQQVYTLLIEIGRKKGDGLPDTATGAALMCFASGIDEAEAVRETVAILKQADTAPLDVMVPWKSAKRMVTRSIRKSAL